MTKENNLETLETGAEKNPLGRESILKLMIKFAVPSIIALLVNSLYNIVDQIFIGQGVGPAGNAATTIAFPLVTLSLALSLLIGAGCAANYNLKLGAKDREGAAKSVGNALVLMLAVSALFLIFGLIFLRPILKLFGNVSQEVMDYAVSYAKITVIGLPFAMIGTALSHMIRADGAPRFSMMFMLIGAVLNTILDPIFIFVCGWGVEGAAWATVIGQIVSFVIAALYLFRYKNIKLAGRHFRLNFSVCLRIMSLGISYFITQLSFFAVQLVMNNMITKYGAQSIYGTDIPIAVTGIIMKVNQILVSVLIGISQGSQPIIGFNYGAGNYRRVRKTYLIAAVSATFFALLGWGCFMIFPQAIINLFGQSDELYNSFALMGFRTFLAAVFVIGFQIVSSNYFQAIGKPLKAAFLNLSRSVLFLVPLAIILPVFYGVAGILYAGPAADAMAAAVSAVFIFLEMRSLTRMIQKSETDPDQNHTTDAAGV